MDTASTGKHDGIGGENSEAATVWKTRQIKEGKHQKHNTW